jgi:hypothetical protein
MTVTIHQPDMMPWLGFFNKIYKADAWVILDHTTNNPRDAAFWGRRVKILVNGDGKWLSLPLKKPDIPGLIGIPINKMEFNNNDRTVYQKALKTVEDNYINSPYFRETYPIVEEFLLSTEKNMCKRNLSFIFRMMEVLNIETEIIYSSELECNFKSTELLVEILQKVNGNTYLCGGGAVGYQKDELFGQAGIKLCYNNYKHPVYDQLGAKNFIPGLSIIDAIFSIGVDRVRSLISL